jgi:hypothetical protein
MAPRTAQRTVYLVTAVIVASMVGGFALATMTLGGTNTSYQGSQTTTVKSVAGLTWLYTNVSVVPGTAAVTNPCTVLASACDVTSASHTICAGGFPGLTCDASDFVENVTLLVGPAAFPVLSPSAVALTVYVTGTPVGGHAGTFAGPTCYFTETAAPGAPEYIVLDFDIGTSGTITPGPGSVTSISVIVTA